MMDDYKWILIGKIVNTQGNKGEICVLPYTDFPDRFGTMDHVLLFHENNEMPRLNLPIEAVRYHKGFVILKLAGIDNIDTAQRLVDMEVKVDQNDVVPLPADRHYIFQLIGLKAVSTEGVELGIICDVLKTAANDVYVIKPHPGITYHKEVLIPVIDSVVLEIDLENQIVTVDLPDGLLE